MNVDSKHIVECFDEIKCLLIGITEIIQEGDDGFEQAIISQTEDIKKVINAFTIDKMTPVVKQTKQEHYFLSTHLKLHDKSQNGSGLTPKENLLLFKARFYLFLKRELPKHELPINLSLYELGNHIAYAIIPNTTYNSFFNTDFDETMLRTIDLVATEIIEHRRKYPQIEIDLNPTVKNNSLIDII